MSLQSHVISSNCSNCQFTKQLTEKFSVPSRHSCSVCKLFMPPRIFIKSHTSFENASLPLLNFIKQFAQGSSIIFFHAPQLSYYGGPVSSKLAHYLFFLKKYKALLQNFLIIITMLTCLTHFSCHALSFFYDTLIIRFQVDHGFHSTNSPSGNIWYGKNVSQPYRFAFLLR